MSKKDGEEERVLSADDGGGGWNRLFKKSFNNNSVENVNSPFQQQQQQKKEEAAFQTPSPTSNRFVGSENATSSHSKKKRPNINSNTHHMTWFNPEAKTAEKRSWLQSNRKPKSNKNANKNIEKVVEEGDDDDDENLSSAFEKKRKRKFTFEKFLVVGLHPDRSDFTAVAESPRGATSDCCTTVVGRFAV